MLLLHTLFVVAQSMSAASLDVLLTSLSNSNDTSGPLLLLTSLVYVNGHIPRMTCCLQHPTGRFFVPATPAAAPHNQVTCDRVARMSTKRHRGTH
eukprot:m.228489 g.228489  ORF g.228489 m.228489 type:complete len:95 (-) comp18829_c0_seq4:148-432(-)